MFGIPISKLFVAGVIAGFIGVSGFFITPKETSTIKLSSTDHTYLVDQTFTVTVVAESSEPVNVFKGLITYDPEIMTVSTISYNTSFIDLWAERPWYSNGEGTLNFIGGTTRSGGFTGEEDLLTITFKAKSTGEAVLAIEDIRILKHDGLGTDAIIKEPIDSVFTIEENQEKIKTSSKPNSVGPVLQVLPTSINTDLNKDGKQSIADTSIFMTHLITQNLRSDFNQDGTVNLKDLSILNRE